jgi:uncharacterized membrane protein YfcA
VHLAEIGTCFASGTAHWRFRNVDWRVVRIMALPGAIGAFFGGVVLSSISAEPAEPVTAAILFVLGAYVLMRFLRPSDAKRLERPSGKPLPGSRSLRSDCSRASWTLPEAAAGGQSAPRRCSRRDGSRHARSSARSTRAGSWWRSAPRSASSSG